jgi:ribosome-binding protein aMBF1 (putative translation factor)
MKKCSLCGVDEGQMSLYEGISKEGIVYICRKCSFKIDIPLIKKKDLSQINFNQKEKVRERLLKLSNIQKDNYNPENPFRPPLHNVDDKDLRKIVEENFKKNLLSEKVNYDDLVPNFHWIVMRTRRIKKISKEQFSKDIIEPIIAVESLEKGILPKDYTHLIKKIENYLGISLFRDKAEKFDVSKLLIESKLSNDITILDFKKIAEREKFDEEFDKKIINPEEITMEKIKEVAGIPINNVGKKNKKNFFEWFFWFKKLNKSNKAKEKLKEETKKS